MALSLYRWSASADRAAQPTRRNLLPRCENDTRSGECDRFKGGNGRQRERRVAMPEAAGGKLVVNRFRRLVARCLAVAAPLCEAQHVLVEAS
jgi:hypothetical protein